MTPTREQVIQWARESGFFFHDAGYAPTLHTLPEKYSEKCFTRLIEKAFAAGAESERNECAKECDKPNEYGFHRTCYEVQDAIRARGKQ